MMANRDMMTNRQRATCSGCRVCATLDPSVKVGPEAWVFCTAWECGACGTLNAMPGVPADLLPLGLQPVVACPVEALSVRCRVPNVGPWVCPVKRVEEDGRYVVEFRYADGPCELTFAPCDVEIVS